MKFQEIILSKLKPSKLNSRTNFDTPEDAELRQSIESNGVIEPIIVRNIKDKLEIICGHRRYYQACKVAKTNGGMTKYTIPVVIRNLTDDQAFEFMVIENYQRQNLTNLEEARSFKKYIDKVGQNHVDDLAQRIGTSGGYIRKRVEIMALPKTVLKLWEDHKLSFGHLEQFLRLQDKTEQDMYIKTTIDQGLTVSRLKSTIDFKTPDLKTAEFNLKTANCHQCHNNSDLQLNLFAIDKPEKTKCLNPKCFIDNTRKFLTTSWTKSKLFKKNHTNGYKFRHEIKQSDYEQLWTSQIDKECKKCQKFVSILDLSNNYSIDTACLDTKCYNKKNSYQRPKKKKKPGEPRCDWHGVYFREKFYKTRIPEIIDQDIKADSEISIRLAVFSVIKTNRFLHVWFAKKYKIIKNISDDNFFRLTGQQIFEPLKKLKLKQLKELLKETISKTIIDKDFYHENREIIAQHLKINLKKEWTPDKEYFAKKHKPEILEIGHKFKIFDQQLVQDYLTKTFNKSSGQFESCKKSELIDLFLKSGVSLAGLVPDEILNIK